MSNVAAVFQLVESGQGAKCSSRISELLSDSLEAVSSGAEGEIVIQQHPLGFLCVKWNIGIGKSLRLHVWSQDMNYRQNPNWPIHDHIFSFKSHVYFGKIQNKIYKISREVEDGKFGIYDVEYTSTQKSRLTQTGSPIAISVESADVYKEGQTYEMRAGILHRTILRSPFAVTVLAATSVEKEAVGRPRVVGARGCLELEYDRQVANNDEVAAHLRKAKQVLTR